MEEQRGDVELSAMELGEVSRLLFGQVNWQEYIRAGVFLSQNEVSSNFFFVFYILNCVAVSIIRKGPG